MTCARYARVDGRDVFAKLLHVIHVLFLVLSLVMIVDFSWGLPIWQKRDIEKRYFSLVFALVLPVLAVGFTSMIIADGSKGRKFKLTVVQMRRGLPVLAWFRPELEDDSD